MTWKKLYCHCSIASSHELLKENVYGYSDFVLKLLQEALAL